MPDNNNGDKTPVIFHGLNATPAHSPSEFKPPRVHFDSTHSALITEVSDFTTSPHTPSVLRVWENSPSPYDVKTTVDITHPRVKRPSIYTFKADGKKNDEYAERSLAILLNQSQSSYTNHYRKTISPSAPNGSLGVNTGKNDAINLHADFFGAGSLKPVARLKLEKIPKKNNIPPFAAKAGKPKKRQSIYTFQEHPSSIGMEHSEDHAVRTINHLHINQQKVSYRHADGTPVYPPTLKVDIDAEPAHGNYTIPLRLSLPVPKTTVSILNQNITLIKQEITKGLTSAKTFVSEQINHLTSLLKRAPKPVNSPVIPEMTVLSQVYRKENSKESSLRNSISASATPEKPEEKQNTEQNRDRITTKYLNVPQQRQNAKPLGVNTAKLTEAAKSQRPTHIERI